MEKTSKSTVKKSPAKSKKEKKLDEMTIAELAGLLQIVNSVKRKYGDSVIANYQTGQISYTQNLQNNPFFAKNTMYQRVEDSILEKIEEKIIENYVEKN